MPIVTTASSVVGVGTYVAAEAYGIPAGADPETQPAQAIVLPYSIQPGEGLQDVADFVQPEPAAPDFTFEWSLAPADGSSAELISGNIAIFMADVEGVYDLTLTATDANGNVGETTWTVYATTYIGNGYFDDEKNDDQCTDCHDDMAAAWAGTGHASMFTRAIDGLVSDHYGPDCITCHTTGFNNRPEAVNGGFDDLAIEAGWTLPETLEPGNWDAMLQDYPQVAGMANVQCESCHGPGYLHVYESSRREPMISLGLSYGVCAQCHAEEPYHIFPQEWELSGHAMINARAFTYPIGEDHAACVRCHSGAGYIDYVNGVPAEESRTDYQVITCAVCHDPHDAANPNQLRVFDSVILPDGTDVTDAGPAATCMTCHNARTDPVASVEGPANGESFGLPHHSTAAELMNGVGGYTWGENMPVSPHGRIVENECIGCHMGATPGMDADGNPLPGHQTVGEHTFSMVSPVDGTENVAICQTCHDGATSFEFEARRDYDGDGTIETNQEEVEGLRGLVQDAIAASGVTILEGRPYYEFPEDATVDQYGAAYNVLFTEAGGTAVHNLRYVVSLLQLSYEKVAGEPVPNATILSPK